MSDQSTRRLSLKLSIMFVLGVALALGHVSDAKSLSKKEAAAVTLKHGADWCELHRPEGFQCKYRPFMWYVRHTSEVYKRRAGGFGFHRAKSTLRFAWATPRNKFGIEMGCGTTVNQQIFGLLPGTIYVRCDRPHKQPSLIGLVRLAGKYY